MVQTSILLDIPDALAARGLPMSPKVSAGVKKILAYPFAQVKEKILKEESVAPDVIDEAIEEFRKYLILICLGHVGIGMLSKEVDEVWHTFILFTKDYGLTLE